MRDEELTKDTIQSLIPPWSGYNVGEGLRQTLESSPPSLVVTQDLTPHFPYFTQ